MENVVSDFTMNLPYNTTFASILKFKKDILYYRTDNLCKLNDLFNIMIFFPIVEYMPVKVYGLLIVNKVI